MRRGTFAVLSVLGACRAPVPERELPSGGPAHALSLNVEPAALEGRIQPVSRFHLSLPRQALPAAEVLVLRGALSEYHLRKIRDGELPNTLSERLVPTLSWSDGKVLSVSPTLELEPSVTYSIASAELGLMGELQVVGDAAPALRRVWPPTGHSASAALWLFCGSGAPESAGAALVSLEPGHVSVWASVGSATGPDGSACLSLVADATVVSPEPLMPPPLALGRALEPAPLAVASGASVESLACAPGELPFGPGCVWVQDDRAVIRGPLAPTLWSVSGSAFSRIERLSAGGRFVLRGLAPSSSEPVSLVVRDVFGEVFRGQVVLQTAPAAPHVVLNEVLANPLGPEPAQEWVELYNDGSTTFDLASLTLRDSAGGTALPVHALAPGAFVLLVREDYAEDSGPDPHPPANATVLRLPSLGSNGLSNGGEALELVRADGQLLSAFPALPKPKSGVSVARRTPWTLDDEPAGFFHHAAPGASPCAPNVLAAE